MQDVHALGVRLHQGVLDPVVHHLDEVPGPHRTHPEVALFLRGDLGGRAGRPRRSRDARRERPEDRLEALPDGIVVAADHQTEPPIEPEHTARRAAVDVDDPALGELAARRRSSR